MRCATLRLLHHGDELSPHPPDRLRAKCNNPFYGCFGFFPVVGSDDERTRFANHAYQKVGGSRNYDACLREWIPLFLKFLLLFLWRLIFIFSFGTIQPFEAAASGGTPALQTLQFSVT